MAGVPNDSPQQDDGGGEGVKRLAWLLTAAWIVQFDGAYWVVLPETMGKIIDIGCESREACEDMAEALNWAHEQRRNALRRKDCDPSECASDAVAYYNNYSGFYGSCGPDSCGKRAFP